MAGLGKIWEVKTQPAIPVVGRALKVFASIKNIGSTSGTLWVYVTHNMNIGVNYVKVGIPPGKIFKWFTCDCGKFNGNYMDIYIEVGRGKKDNLPDESMDFIIKPDEELHYIAGEEVPQKNFSLTTKVDGEGAIQIDPAFGPYAPGTEVKVFAVRQSGWKFKEWKEDLSGTKNPTTIIMDKNKKITAVYKKL